MSLNKNVDSSTTLRAISHVERRNHKFDMKIDCTPKPTIRRVRVQKLDPVTNIITTKTEMRTIDRVEEMRPYHVSDFSIANLTAVGAKLTPSVLTGSPHKSVSDMERVLSGLEITDNDN